MIGRLRTIRVLGTGATWTFASAITAAVGALAGYLTVLTASALNWGKSPARTHSDLPQLRFAIVVPAHNEELLIAQALESFERLDYPVDRYKVHVVADNCSDSTADVVRASSATLHERHDLSDPGKGAALNWLLARLSDEGFDAFVVVDADTSLDASFLAAMNQALGQGAVAAQGFYGVRTPEASAAAGLRYAALACRHHLRPLGRTRIGASCGLYGNGMTFRSGLLAGRRWSGHLTEDIEFQMQLLMDGHLVRYVPGARLEAEMPDSLDSSTTQNERWELGRIQMARRFVPPLIRRAVTGRPDLRTAHLDAVLDHLTPPLSVLAAAQLLSGALALALRLVSGRRGSRLLVWFNATSSSLLAVHVFVGLRSVDAPRSVYRSLRSAPRMLWWKAGLWLRVIARPDGVTWSRTDRNQIGGSR